MLKIMLVNDADHRLGRLRRALEDAGINIVAEVDGGMHLPQYIEAVQPDAILIDSDSPSSLSDYFAIHGIIAPCPAKR